MMRCAEVLGDYGRRAEAAPGQRRIARRDPRAARRAPIRTIPDSAASASMLPRAWRGMMVEAEHEGARALPISHPVSGSVNAVGHLRAARALSGGRRRGVRIDDSRSQRGLGCRADQQGLRADDRSARARRAQPQLGRRVQGELLARPPRRIAVLEGHREAALACFGVIEFGGTLGEAEANYRSGGNLRRSR